MSNQYPPLPEPTDMALVYGPGMTGTTYATLSKSYEPSCAMFNVAQLRAYADATVVLRSVPRLTDAEIDALWAQVGDGTAEGLRAFARAIEARKPADATAQPPKAQEPPACGGCNNQFCDECGGSGVKGGA